MVTFKAAGHARSGCPEAGWICYIRTYLLTDLIKRINTDRDCIYCKMNFPSSICLPPHPWIDKRTKINKLKKWVRNKISSIDDTDDNPKSVQLPLYKGMPVLPRERRHVLTPSPSHENLIQPTMAATSAFFQTLPPELRRWIYIYAFGGRIIHMDLRYNDPKIRGRHQARINGDSSCPQDPIAKPGWVWWSSVCYRRPGKNAWRDTCWTESYGNARVLRPSLCLLRPGTGHDKCFLGVMGWLLTCRRA